MNRLTKWVKSPPSYEAKVARGRQTIEQTIEQLKELRPRGWRKQVKEYEKKIKLLDQEEAWNRLEKLEKFSKTIIRRFTKDGTLPNQSIDWKKIRKLERVVADLEFQNVKLKLNLKEVIQELEKLGFEDESRLEHWKQSIK